MKRIAILILLATCALAPVHAQDLTAGASTVEGCTNCCASTNGTDSYTCSLTRGLGSYQDGACYAILPDVTNNGAASLALNGLAAKSIVRSDGSSLQGDGAGSLADEITADYRFYVCYNSGVDKMVLQGAIPAAGSALPPFLQIYTNANPWTLTGATHGQGANIEVFTQLDNGTTWRKIDPASIDINKSTGDVTVAWATNRSGRITVSQLAGSNLGPSAPTDHAALTNLPYAQSGHTGFAAETHASRHQHGGADEVANATAGANRIPKTGASGLLLEWVPVMGGDSGSGGTKGLVPAPAAGDAAKCLLGDGTWGSCASGVAGVSSFGSDDRTGAVDPADGDYNASQVVFTPAGTIAATRVDTALAEVASEAVAVSSKDQPSGVAALDGSSKITRSTMPVMVGDSGSGGSAGAVPAPGTGDATNCLKGDATWGECGTGGGSGIAVLGGGSSISGAPASVTKLNFTGSGVSTTWNVAQSRVDVSISGGGGAGTCVSGDGYVCQGDDADMSGNVSVAAGNRDYTINIPNNSSTGTTIYKFVTLTSTNPVTATVAGTSATKVVGVCVANCGTTGSARIAVRGQALLLFDSTPTAGDWVLAGTSGNATSQSGKPSAPLGLVYSSTSEGGKYRVILLGF